MRPHVVAMAVTTAIPVFEFAVPCEVFGVDRADLASPWYDLRLCAAAPGPLRTTMGLRIDTPYGLDDLLAADTILVPACARMTQREPPAQLVDALRRAHAKGVRIASICTGAYVLAAAGLLDGRRATTHWRYAERLRRRYPAVDVDPDVLYVDGGDVLTSAGSAAGLDLCLHVVRRDFGAAIANAVARRLVIQPHRDGGQAQFVEAPVAEDPDDDRVAGSMAWALANLTAAITVETLARRAHMSPRTYLRHFARATGTSPIRWLVNQRVQASLALLETTQAPVEEVARAVGFDTPVTYRHHFGQTMKTSPSAYRRAFQVNGAAARRG
jgi:AraC family transcriptional activator FtrA